MHPRRSYLIILLQTALRYCLSQNDVRLPPSITEGPPKEYLFLYSSTIRLTCDAVGSAELNYIWRKNDFIIDCASNTRYLCVGNKLTGISNGQSSDEGLYQCFVSNAYGSTMSDLMRVRMKTYAPGSAIVTHIASSVNAGLELACNAPYTVPSLEEKAENADGTDPGIDWGTATGPNDSNVRPITPSQRVQISRRTGNLFFANFEATGETFYKCIVRVLGGSVYSGFTNVTVAGTVSNFPVTRMFTTVVPTVGLEEQSVIFQCFFSGRPTPTLNAASWKKINGSLPVGRYIFSDFNTKLKITNLLLSDAGDYTCEPAGQPELAQRMTLRVEAAPIFRKEDDKPYNMNVTEGDTVTVRCNAHAVPPATVAWYRNGDMLVPGLLPPKFTLSADGTQLTISNVCRDCPGGSSDLMSLQCNASNIHGYSFAQGYFNVLPGPTDVCLSSPCVHGTACFDSLGDFKCECEPGYTGRRCENAICLSSPCVHGTACFDHFGDYKCECKPGYTGQRCESPMRKWRL